MAAQVQVLSDFLRRGLGLQRLLNLVKLLCVASLARRRVFCLLATLASHAAAPTGRPQVHPVILPPRPQTCVLPGEPPSSHILGFGPRERCTAAQFSLHAAVARALLENVPALRFYGVPFNLLQRCHAHHARIRRSAPHWPRAPRCVLRFVPGAPLPERRPDATQPC